MCGWTTRLATGTTVRGAGGEVTGQSLTFPDQSGQSYLVRVLPGPDATAGPPARYALDVRSLTADLGMQVDGVQSGRLVVKESPHVDEGAEFELDTAPVTIGRTGQNDVVLEGDEFASARHARVDPRRDGVWVLDLDSTNGTYVNGLRIDAPQRLSPGDIVRVGETELRFEG